MAKQADPNTPFNINNSPPSQFPTVFKIFITSIKNFQRNKLLFLTIALFAAFLNIGVIVALFLSITPLSKDIVTNYNIFTTYALTSSTTSIGLMQSALLKIQKDITSLLGVEIIIVVALYVISWFTTVATIYVSAMSHLHKDITFREMVLGTKKNLKKLGSTLFYVTLLSTGYMLLFVACVPLVVLLYLSSKLMFAFCVALLIFPFSLFWLYLVVVSMISLVVSVLEEDYGFQAIGKAERLVRGRKAQGVVICLVLMAESSVFLLPYSMRPRQVWIAIAAAVAKMIFSSLFTIFSLMVYTVFYFECKKSHGEEVDEYFEVDVSYAKVATIPLVDSSLP